MIKAYNALIYIYGLKQVDIVQVIMLRFVFWLWYSRIEQNNEIKDVLVWDAESSEY